MRIVLALVVLCTLLSASLCADTDLVNSKVERLIDLKSQIARHSINITVNNKGTTPATQYLLTLQDRYQTSHLAFIKVVDETGTPLAVTKGDIGTNNKESYTAYKVDLGKSLAAGQSTTISISLGFTHTMKPYPTHITQTDPQLVRYFDNHFLFSPYSTASQRTVVKLASSKVEHFSENAPTQHRGDTITYGPYDDIRAFTHSELLVHFVNNAPFITVAKMVKEIEISHWGNLAVEQWLEVVHEGAILKGSFSRFDFQRNPGSSPSAVLQLTEVLPLGAADVYYRDDIGNISTSTFTVSPKGLELHLVPRFPLFGGWKNNFYMGYNLPLESYLYNDVNDRGVFVLNTTFAVDMGDIVIDDFVVRVTLPEGASNPAVVTPFPIENQHEAKHFTYLDTTGRTVLVVEKRNVISEHNQYFQVSYHFSRLSMLHEPLLVTGAFFCFILAIMAYVRINISITKGSTTPVEQDLKYQKVLTRFREILDARNREYANLDALQKSVSDPTQLKVDRSRIIDVRFQPLKQEVGHLIHSLSKINPSLADKLRAIEDLETSRLDAKLALQDLDVSFRGNAIKKPRYEKEKEELQTTIYSTMSEIAQLAEELLA